MPPTLSLLLSVIPAQRHVRTGAGPDVTSGTSSLPPRTGGIHGNCADTVTERWDCRDVMGCRGMPGWRIAPHRCSVGENDG